MEIVLRKEYFKFINYWLLTLLFLIALIIIVGGLTRLTDSGLSITTWDVVKGILPPLNKADWKNPTRTSRYRTAHLHQHPQAQRRIH